MWRTLLAVILLPSLTAAQAPPEVKPEFSDDTVKMILNGPPRASAPRSQYQSYTRHTAIRRGRDEDVGIELWLSGVVVVRESKLPGVLPLTVEFEPLDGLTVQQVRGPRVSKINFPSAGSTIEAAQAPYLQFKIRANSNAPLGTRILTGKFRFQQLLVGGAPVGPVEQVDVRIPLTVVEHDAKVQKADFPYAPMPTWEKVLLIGSIPVLIVVFIPLLLFCTITGTCPDC